ncbi:hypothetical protein D3C71_1571730 [compost metagenome]
MVALTSEYRVAVASSRAWGRVFPSTSRPSRVAANTSPMPLGSGCRSMRGVVTSQAPVPLTASVPSWSAAISGVARLVMMMVSGPRPRNWRATATASSMLASLEPVNSSNSNWLGVMMLANGMAWSRRKLGMAGFTNRPRPTSPITGSHR